MKNPLFFKILFIVCVLIFIFPRITQCIEVPLFPFFSLEKESQTNKWEWNLLYPILHFMRSGNETELIIPILFSLVKNNNPQTISIDLLWPLFIYRLKPRPGGDGYKSQVSIFPLFFHTQRSSPDLRDKKGAFFPLLFWGKDRNDHPYFIVFPFFWFARNALIPFPFPSIYPQTYLAFMPFFGRFHNLAGNDLMQTYMWPLFIKVEHKDREKYHFLWPFFGFGKGEDYRAYRIWPLFVWARHPDGSLRYNYLWPLGYHRSKINEEGEKTVLDMFFPLYLRLRSPREKWDNYLFLYGQRRSPLRRQWALFWPIFKTAFYPESGARQITLFLLLFDLKNDPQDRNFQFFPFYGKREKPKRIRSFVLWPIYHYKYDDYDSYTFTRKYLFPFYFHKKWERENNETESRTLVFPFYAKKIKSRGSWETSALHVFYHDKADAVERNWCSLLPFYESRGEDDRDYSVRIFWKLFFKGRKDGQNFWELNPLVFQWKTEEKKREFNLLGGIFGIKKNADKTSLKLFFIPLSKNE